MLYVSITFSSVEQDQLILESAKPVGVDMFQGLGQTEQNVNAIFLKRNQYGDQLQQVFPFPRFIIQKKNQVKHLHWKC